MAAAREMYLDEDKIKVPGQNFLLLSVVSPQSHQNR
jgi:hypothetical protein